MSSAFARSVSAASDSVVGFSPATRVFEAAGAGACLITDDFVGIETFFEPGEEILVARSGDDVAEHVRSLTASRAKQIGDAALVRVLAEHTYDHRAALFDEVLNARTKRPTRDTGFQPVQTVLSI